MLRLLVQHALVALFPRSDGLDGIESMAVEAYVPRMLADASWVFWLGVVASTLAFVCSPILTVWWPLPSFLLPRSVLDRHARASADSNLYALRNATFMLKMVGGLHWAAAPSVRAHFALQPYAPDPEDWRTE